MKIRRVFSIAILVAVVGGMNAGLSLSSQIMHELFTDPLYRETIEVPAFTKHGEAIKAYGYSVEIVTLDIIYRKGDTLMVSSIVFPIKSTSTGNNLLQGDSGFNYLARKLRKQDGRIAIDYHFEDGAHNQKFLSVEYLEAIAVGCEFIEKFKDAIKQNYSKSWVVLRGEEKFVGSPSQKGCTIFLDDASYIRFLQIAYQDEYTFPS